MQLNSMVSDPPHLLLSQLNPPQRDAVTLPSGSMLVLAGAGSGKTRVLTTRIAWLLSTQSIRPQNILAVTFTNKAAKEIYTRVANLVGENIKAMWVGTFHGLCHKLLRMHHQSALLPRTFQIIDSADQLSLIKRLLKKEAIAEELMPPRLLQYFINQQKESGQRSYQLSASNEKDKLLIALFKEYEAYCQEAGFVDFAELLLKSYELLQENTLLAQHYQERFLHILVDEFQDTSLLQYQWLKSLMGSSSSLFAVGDDDQSIYSFRGAHVGNMNTLLSDYQISTPICLEQNYRSVGHVLSASHAVIKDNKGRLDKKLWTASEVGDPLFLFEAFSDMAEAAFVASEVKGLEKEGIHLDKIALLYRSNAQSRLFEKAFFESGIPYRIYGGTRFFERQEIKHALAYLRLMMNVNDDEALLRIINIPARGIGVSTIKILTETAQSGHISLWQAAQIYPNSKLMNFIALIEKMRSLSQGMALSALVEVIITESGLRGLYEKEQKLDMDRVANLNELVSAATNFVAETGEEPLVAFLNNAALESGEYQAKTGQLALQMMTVHAAKGLEFDVVFIAGLEEGLFPHENALSNPEGIEEERRLMYVAMTRAKKNLYLTYAKKRLLHGWVTSPFLSRFVKAIPQDLLKKHRQSFSFSVDKPLEKSLPKKREEGKDLPYQIGWTVLHPRFGEGVVTDLQKMGKSFKVVVHFSAVGTKCLDTAYAKLEVLQSS